jgi:large repetitive protein
VGDYASPTFADIDGDGDLDAFVGNGGGEGGGNILYFENTESSTAPSFGEVITNPFGLSGVGDYAVPTFADIDEDGDLDAFVGSDDDRAVRLFRNIGSSTAPLFSTSIVNPFGLETVGSMASPALVDIDGDSDLDIFVGDSA